MSESISDKARDDDSSWGVKEDTLVEIPTTVNIRNRNEDDIRDDASTTDDTIMSLPKFSEISIRSRGNARNLVHVKLSGIEEDDRIGETVGSSTGSSASSGVTEDTSCVHSHVHKEHPCCCYPCHNRAGCGEYKTTTRNCDE